MRLVIAQGQRLPEMQVVVGQADDGRGEGGAAVFGDFDAFGIFGVGLPGGDAVGFDA